VAAAQKINEPVAEREHTISRVFDVPARYLFEAYSKPEHVRRWFGPKGWPLTGCEIDFRVGGRFRFTMTGPDGTRNPPFGGTYLEIVPNRKIVYSVAFDDSDTSDFVATVSFDEQAGKTTLTIHALFSSAALMKEAMGTGAPYRPGDFHHGEEGYQHGTESALHHLAELVAELQARV